MAKIVYTFLCRLEFLSGYVFYYSIMLLSEQWVAN